MFGNVTMLELWGHKKKGLKILRFTPWLHKTTFFQTKVIALNTFEQIWEVQLERAEMKTFRPRKSPKKQ